MNKSLTKSEAIQVLTGEGGETLKLIISGDKDEHKWFLNEEPISKEEFNRLSDKPIKKCNCKVDVTIGENGLKMLIRI